MAAALDGASLDGTSLPGLVPGAAVDDVFEEVDGEGSAVAMLAAKAAARANSTSGKVLSSLDFVSLLHEWREQELIGDVPTEHDWVVAAGKDPPQPRQACLPVAR